MHRYLLPAKRQKLDGSPDVHGATTSDESSDRDHGSTDVNCAEPQPQEGTAFTQPETTRIQ